jgi:hypothetical protein
MSLEMSDIPKNTVVYIDANIRNGAFKLWRKV